MDKNKAEGAEFLRRLGILIMGLGGLGSIIIVLIGVGSEAYEYFLYAIALFLVSSLLFGICVNLASINKNICDIINSKKG